MFRRAATHPYALLPKFAYVIGVANPESIDLFVSTEEEVEVDAETTAAIERGIQAADEERFTTLDQAREQMKQWLLKSSSPSQH